jgi:hypothetical protein
MGLNTTHNAWHGPYSSFNNFRRAILKAYNNTDLFEYGGYESRCKKDLDKQSPGLALSNIDDDGILLLMDHSDCEGLIRWVDCKLVADSLGKIISKVATDYFTDAIDFQKGCLLAYNNKEDLLFG